MSTADTVKAFVRTLAQESFGAAYVYLVQNQQVLLADETIKYLRETMQQAASMGLPLPGIQDTPDPDYIRLLMPPLSREDATVMLPVILSDVLTLLKSASERGTDSAWRNFMESKMKR